MLMYRGLGDPIGIPSKIEEIDFGEYSGQSGPTSESELKLIRQSLYDMSGGAETSRLDQIWDFAGPKIAGNADTARFILDHKGHKSRFFLPWWMNVYKSMAAALGMAYGIGQDLDGNWHENILETDDPIVRFVLHDPAFIYHRFRHTCIANLAYAISEGGAKRVKIVDFGAGQLDWARHHKLNLAPWVEIRAFDTDKSIDVDKITKEVRGYPKVYYEFASFNDQLTNPDCKDADLIILGGVASYIDIDSLAKKIVPALYNLLADDGVVCLDFQTYTPCYEHSMDVLGWQKFNLPKKPADIVALVEKIRASLQAIGARFVVSYTEDTINKIASGVIVTIQKI